MRASLSRRPSLAHSVAALAGRARDLECLLVRVVAQDARGLGWRWQREEIRAREIGVAGLAREVVAVLRRAVAFVREFCAHRPERRDAFGHALDREAEEIGRAHV